MSLLFRLDHESLPFSVVIEDDDRVAYAYLLHAGSIVSDVWLYNCIQTPEQPEWSDSSRAPFANPRGYAKRSMSKRIASADDVRVSWIVEGANLVRVELYRGVELCAVVAPGMKPGYSRNAAKDGPLANAIVMDSALRTGGC